MVWGDGHGSSVAQFDAQHRGPPLEVGCICELLAVGRPDLYRQAHISQFGNGVHMPIEHSVTGHATRPAIEHDVRGITAHLVIGESLLVV